MQKTGAIRFLRRSLGAGLAAGAAVFLMPLMLLGQAAEPEPPAAILSAEPAAVSARPSPSPSAKPDPGADADFLIHLLQPDGTVDTLSLADYLWSVTAAEMPASFEPEALRAQSVCARTYALWRKNHPGKHPGAEVCTDSSCCQAYITREEAARRWGERAEEYTAKIAAAVSDTAGVVATYGGEPIQAVFFSSAAGRTVDAAEVWGNALPYLISVESPEGDEVPDYHSQVTLSAEEVKALVQTSYPGADLSGDPAGWFSEPAYTDSGRVDSIAVGGITLSGGAARNLFSLRSACFTISYGAQGFTFAVTGYGHGVGLSQYGANAMARAGSSWREIIEHYYTGVTLENPIP